MMNDRKLTAYEIALKLTRHEMKYIRDRVYGNKKVKQGSKSTEELFDGY